MQNSDIVVVGNSLAGGAQKALLKQVRGSFWRKLDTRMALIALFSVLIHALLLIRLNTIEVKPVEPAVIERMPERLAKLIVEKPIPKAETKPKVADNTATKKNETTAQEKSATSPTATKKTMDRKTAKKAVARRAARVEKKIRTVGVLGMLTGVGATAKGQSVVDVLGNIHNKKERHQDLEKALSNMSGLQQTKNLKVMNRKLIRSKDVSISHKQSIDNLVASIGLAKTNTFSKKGNFIIQRPESIEGAASSNTKRNNSAINKIVSRHKTSIRMSYEKYLNRVPDLAGKITIRFTISSAGRVISVDIIENTTNNEQLVRDILRKVKMWRFDSIPEGDVTVTYPFVFRPS